MLLKKHKLLKIEEMNIMNKLKVYMELFKLKNKKELWN